MKLHHGWAFPDDDVFMAAQITPDGRYQADHLDEALRHVADFSVAIDGGAHVGTWSRLLATRFDRVLAIEPSADTFEALLVNLAGAQNVEAVQAALGAAEGRVSMAIDATNEARKNTGARFVQAGGDIPLITIDSLQLPTLGLLKLDIEGSEASALVGARATLRRCHPVVIFEEKGFGSRFGSARGQSAAVLKTLGYRHLASVSADQIWGVA